MDEKKLTPEMVEKLSSICNMLNEMADAINGEPFDPKVAALLQMAADMVEEQIHMEKFYQYPEYCGDEPLEESDENIDKGPDFKYKFFDNEETNTNIPTGDELAKWMSEGAPKDDE